MDYLTGHMLSQTFHVIKGLISRETKPSPENRSTLLSSFDLWGDEAAVPEAEFPRKIEVRKGKVFTDTRYWLKKSLIHFGDLEMQVRIKLI